MLDLDRIVSAIKESVSAVQAAKMLGLKTDRMGRCHCVWHTDKNPSMKVYEGNRGCWCFACNHGGDVIDLVRQANGMTLIQAIEWLNSAFHLGLPLDRPMDKNAEEAARIAQEQRRMEREQQRRIEREKFDQYVDAVKRIGDLESDLEQYRPTRPDQPWDERFCAALRTLPEAKDTAERLAVEVIKK